MYKREVGRGGLFMMTSIRVREDILLYELGLSRGDVSDSLDREAYHAIIYDFGSPIGSARLVLDNEEWKIDRVMLVKAHRNKKLHIDLIDGLKSKALELDIEDVVVAELDKGLV